MPDLAINDPNNRSLVHVCEFSYALNTACFKITGLNVSELLDGAPLLGSNTSRFVVALGGIEGGETLLNFILTRRQEASPQAVWNVID